MDNEIDRQRVKFLALMNHTPKTRWGRAALNAVRISAAVAAFTALWMHMAQ